MTQPVKLHILSPDHAGPVPGTGAGIILTRPLLSGNGRLLARMAYHDGTLYTDTEPLEWNAVDADRASALGYGPSDPWPEFPAPDLIKPAPATQYLTPKVDSMIRMDPAQQLKALKEARRNKVRLLNVHILPKYGALLIHKAVRVVEAKTNRTTMLDFYEFDALTIGQLVHRIQTRLQ